MRSFPPTAGRHTGRPDSTSPGEPPSQQTWLGALVLTAACLCVGLGLLVGTGLLNRHVRSHPKRFELERPRRDMRQILVDHLVQDPSMCDADSVILGSSRMRVAGDIVIDGERFVNLSVLDAMPEEYGPYVRLFERQCQKTPQTILLGLDFFASSVHRVATPEPPTYYIDKATNPSYRLGWYDDLSITSTERTWDLWWDYTPRKHFSKKRFEETWAPSEWRLKRAEKEALRLSFRKAYVRDASASCPVPRLRLADQIGPSDSSTKYLHRAYYEKAYGEYHFDPGVMATLRQFHDDYPDSRFVAFLTPVSHVLYDALARHELLEALASYESMLAAEFGSFTSFMGIDSVTSDRRNFQDDNHLTKPAMDVMVRRVLGEDVGPEDFGRRLHGESPTELLQIHEAFNAMPRVKRTPRFPRQITSIDYDVLNARPRQEHIHRGDCTVDIAPNRHLDVALGGVRHAPRLELLTSRTKPVTVEFRLAGARVGRVQVPKDNTPRHGLTTRMLDVPSSAREGGYDTVRVVSQAREGFVGVGYLALHADAEPGT